MLSLATKNIHVSRDVSFHENVFPFAITPDVSSFPSVLKYVPFIDFLDDIDNNTQPMLKAIYMVQIS